jgi:protein-S-isoprenylcysteine O-methyltransferase Ste14
MNPWYAKVAVIVTLIGYSIIRGPHGQRSRAVRIVEDRKDGLELVLLAGAFLGTTILPLVWVATEFPRPGNYPLHPVPYALGLLVMLGGLWVFHRSHSDLGSNWSITLQLREQHRLVTTGIYRRVRHPMYASMFLLSIAHVLFVPNWIVAAAYFLSFGILYIFRVDHEERMMLDRFGPEYQTYVRQSGRVMPRLRQPADRKLRGKT